MPRHPQKPSQTPGNAVTSPAADICAGRGGVTAGVSLDGCAELFTIGYEGRCFADYAAVLVDNNVDLVCDVRRNAVSRKPGFSKKAMAGNLTNLGISYRHFPELGVEPALRRDLNTQDDRDRLFRAYRQSLLTQPLLDELSNIAGLLDVFNRAALTCFEADPLRCHRHCLTDRLRDTHGWQTTHL